MFVIERFASPEDCQRCEGHAIFRVLTAAISSFSFDLFQSLSKHLYAIKCCGYLDGMYRLGLVELWAALVHSDRSTIEVGMDADCKNLLFSLTSLIIPKHLRSILSPLLVRVQGVLRGNTAIAVFSERWSAALCFESGKK